jgi:peptidoglycan/LPS O-acetylase OafA/YrhL
MVFLTRDSFGKPGVSGQFLARRVIRIAPPYWLFTTLMLASALIFEGHVNNPELGRTQIISSYALLPWPRTDGSMYPVLSHGWTLNYEMFFYVAFGAALLFRRGLAILAGGFLLLVALHPWIPEAWFILSYWSRPIILEFLAGIGLALIYVRGKRLPLWACLICAILGIVLALMPPTIDTGIFRRVTYNGVPALFICIALMFGPEPDHIGRVGRSMRLGGDASYALYLSHPFVLVSFAILWKHMGFSPSDWAMAAGIVLALAASILVFHFVERPMTAAIRRFASSKRIGGAAPAIG